jgi:hypothetical protein
MAGVSQVRVNRRSRLQPRLLAAALALVVAGLPFAGCKEAEEESSAGYEPAKLEVQDSEGDIQRITFTKEGAARVDLQTARVRRNGEHKVIPYAALIYDDEAKTFAYTSPEPLSFLRAPVTVDRIEGDRVLLSDGPPAGAKVVTVGATEVYGVEQEIAESQ